MRKPARDVNFDDILSGNFYGPEQASLIDPILRGHLTLEAILVEIIQTRLPGDRAWKWNFPTKTQYLIDNNMMPPGLKPAFDKINDLRNDFAHSFGHSVTPKYLLNMATELEEAGIDFSDSIGHYPEDTALEYYSGIEGILSEILWCVLFEAAFILGANGGRTLFAD